MAVDSVPDCPVTLTSDFRGWLEPSTRSGKCEGQNIWLRTIFHFCDLKYSTDPMTPLLSRERTAGCCTLPSLPFFIHLRTFWEVFCTRSCYRLWSIFDKNREASKQGVKELDRTRLTAKHMVFGRSFCFLAFLAACVAVFFNILVSPVLVLPGWCGWCDEKAFRRPCTFYLAGGWMAGGLWMVWHCDVRGVAGL